MYAAPDGAGGILFAACDERCVMLELAGHS